MRAKKDAVVRKPKPRPRKRQVSIKLTLGYYLRNLKELGEWRKFYRDKYEGKCAVSGIKPRFARMIQIHHTKPFAKIRDEVLKSLDLPFCLLKSAYSEEELEKISEKFIKAHEKVEGIPLLKKVHKKFHSLYGYNATVENYHDFKKRWDEGEFKI